MSATAGRLNRKLRTKSSRDSSSSINLTRKGSTSKLLTGSFWSFWNLNSSAITCHPSLTTSFNLFAKILSTCLVSKSYQNPIEIGLMRNFKQSRTSLRQTPLSTGIKLTFFWSATWKSTKELFPLIPLNPRSIPKPNQPIKPTHLKWNSHPKCQAHSNNKFNTP